MKNIERLKKEVKQIMKNDPAHDFDHILRDLKNANYLSKKEGADTKIVSSAVLLHDLVHYPKSEKRSKSSATKSAILAQKILKKYNFSKNEIAIVADAIETHSYSKGKTPKSLEGKILQDADRLDAIGAIGIARVFAVSGFEGRSFYDKRDPFCSKRKPNDKRWAIDHFFNKLLKLEELMNTRSAKIEAGKRTRFLKNYLQELEKEI